MSLKKGEKVMLQVFVLFIPLALILVFLLLPELQKKLELQTQLSELTTQYEAMKQVAEDESLQVSYEEQQKIADQNYEYFYSELKSYSIDTIINQQTEKHGLSVQSMNINEYRSAAEDFVTEENTKPVDVLIKSEVSLSVKGNYENILAFMDAMNDESICVQLEMVSISENKSDATGLAGMEASFQILMYGIDGKQD